MATQSERQKLIAARPIADALPMTYGKNDEKECEMRIGGTIADDGTHSGYFVISGTKEKTGDLWRFVVPRMRYKNASGTLAMTDGYTSEKPQAKDSAIDHCAIAFGRQVVKALGGTLITDAETKMSAAEKDTAIAVGNAKNKAYAFIVGDSAERLSDAERNLCDAAVLKRYDAAVALADADADAASGETK